MLDVAAFELLGANTQVLSGGKQLQGGGGSGIYFQMITLGTVDVQI